MVNSSRLIKSAKTVALYFTLSFFVCLPAEILMAQEGSQDPLTSGDATLSSPSIAFTTVTEKPKCSDLTGSGWVNPNRKGSGSLEEKESVGQKFKMKISKELYDNLQSSKPSTRTEAGIDAKRDIAATSTTAMRDKIRSRFCDQRAQCSVGTTGTEEKDCSVGNLENFKGPSFSGATDSEASEQAEAKHLNSTVGAVTRSTKDGDYFAEAAVKFTIEKGGCACPG